LYEASHKIDKFDLAIDFGWFYFITKPLFYFLQFLQKTIGSTALAILVITILSKIALYSFSKKSFVSMFRMRLIAPKIEQLKQRYGDDKMRMNQELMALYKKEGANPMSGCLPQLIQAPIFFCLYKVFYVTIEMRHAPMYWIKDLSMPDPTSVFNLFGLIPYEVPTFLKIGILPLLMGATMLLQQRMGPQPSDPAQARIMLIMPIMFTYLFAGFPAGVVLYWTFSNILTILQQYYFNKYSSTNITMIKKNAK
jgi:YidC/Oxa1 family membrane protein insertase